MIEVVAPGASADEIAAIVAALSSRARTPAVEGRPSPWALAARYPELDFDDLRALVVGR
jgi:hypothetical protein